MPSLRTWLRIWAGSLLELWSLRSSEGVSEHACRPSPLSHAQSQSWGEPSVFRLTRGVVRFAKEMKHCG